MCLYKRNFVFLARQAWIGRSPAVRRCRILGAEGLEGDGSLFNEAGEDDVKLVWEGFNVGFDASELI